LNGLRKTIGSDGEKSSFVSENYGGGCDQDDDDEGDGKLNC